MVALRKTTKTVPHGSRCSGTVVRPSAILNEAGFDCARLGVPELGRLSGHAEGCVDGLVAVVAVVDEVEIAVRQLAMDK